MTVQLTRGRTIPDPSSAPGAIMVFILCAPLLFPVRSSMFALSFLFLRLLACLLWSLKK
jgi:hypothetical protein